MSATIGWPFAKRGTMDTNYAISDKAAMPFRLGSPARARFAIPGASAGAPSIDILIDPWRRRVLSVDDPRRHGAAQSFAAWQRPLHEGQGLGPIWKALVFVSGFLPLLFSITGVYMWLLKRRARRVRA